MGRVSETERKADGLDLRDILITDATIIAGVLILLSISASTENRIVGVVTPIGLFTMTLGIVVLFSLSAFFALEGDKRNAKKHAQWGFVAVLLTFGLILFGTIIYQIQHPATP